MHPVEKYLAELHACLGAGTPETSGYPALSNLLNAVGETLRPKIRAVIHPKDTGGKQPDGGLFSAKELRNCADGPSLLNITPERGVIEVKSPAQDIGGLEQTPQVRGYLEHYRQILLTNYRSFALFSWEAGKPLAGERFSIADSESAFWEINHARRTDPILHERLWQFLRRALLSNARIATPQDLAAFLASYAREARARVEVAPLKTLEPVKKALGESLGISFEGEKGEYFFRSTLIQTLFYGIFSAWVLWHESRPKPGERFAWKTAAFHLGLPVLRSLFVQLADPTKVRALHLEEVLDWAEACLGRVDRVSFFARYDMGEAVQYFYEPFLAEFDPELRKDFGVWYTPPEIVRYMVGRVDQSLRENFGLPDGLADPRVVVLDPCCGTGAYLVETLRLIHGRVRDALGETQAALQIKQAARSRLYGFELLPAPYVVSHLQLDLMLSRWGAPLDHAADERAGVYLTNALTGWVPPKAPKDQLLFQEFSDERDAANMVKREADILVVIGNPPYDGFAGIMKVQEERALTEAYRTVKAVQAPQGQGLNDLYIRFFRMAERRIVEGVPQDDDPAPGPPLPDASGVICFISNYSWLDGLSHTGMRERYLEVFDRIHVDCLNGDKYKTGKKTPDGKPDPSVFPTERNPVGIQVGTAIALMERFPAKQRAKESEPPDPNAFCPRAEVSFHHWWGKRKRADLLEALDRPQPRQTLRPIPKLGLPFVPVGVNPAYDSWPLLTELLPVSFPGVKTSRDEALVDIDRETLERRMSRYFDPGVDFAALGNDLAPLLKNSGRFDARRVRDEVIAGGIGQGRIVRYCYRPFDCRWLFWHPVSKLLDEKRPEYVKHVFDGNLWLSATQRNRKEGFYCPQVSRCLADHHIVESNVGMFPLLLKPADGNAPNATPELDFAGAAPKTGPQPNLSDSARAYLDRLGATPEDLFFHIIAVLHAPAYRAENAGALRQGWPRVPLPGEAKTLRAGADLGRMLAALLDPEVPVAGVTDLKVRADLKGLGELAVGGGKKTAPDLAIDARWGYAGQNGVTMPGPGKVASGTRGEGFLDIYLNATARWKDVPEGVWSYTLGGYQVLKKWLSYRESALLGRPLTSAEAEEFTHHVRRIAAILALGESLDGHYRASTAAVNCALPQGA